MNLRLVTDPAPQYAAPEDFAEAMCAHAGSVVLVTCLLDGRPWGATVTAFASVSADPPTVLVSLRTEGSAARAIAATGRFGVSILAQEQREVARLGAAARVAGFLDRFVEPRGAHVAPGTSPAVAGALAHLDCALHEAIPVADHTVFLGRIRTARAARPGAPLLYHRREYRELATTDTEWSTRWLGN